MYIFSPSLFLLGNSLVGKPSPLIPTIYYKKLQSSADDLVLALFFRILVCFHAMVTMAMNDLDTPANQSALPLGSLLTAKRSFSEDAILLRKHTNTYNIYVYRGRRPSLAIRTLKFTLSPLGTFFFLVVGH